MTGKTRRDRLAEALSRAATGRGYRLRGERFVLADAVLAQVEAEHEEARREERGRAEVAEAAIERVRDLASDDADLRSGVVGMVRVSDIRRALDRTEADYG